MANRYDVTYHQHHVSVAPHFCREWDEEGGCYGTNPDHGLSLEEAARKAAEFHEREAEAFRNGTHHSLLSYKTEE